MKGFYSLIVLTSLAMLFGDEPIFFTYYTFKNDPCVSIQLNIQTASDAPLTVELKLDDEVVEKRPSFGKLFELPDTSRYLHHLDFSDLQPQTRYQVVILGPSGQQAISSFTTLSSDFTKMRWIVGGDLEIIGEAEPILKQMAAHEPDIIIFGGDYPKDVASLADYRKWDEWLKQTTKLLVKKNGDQIPWVLAIGNNEVFGSFNQPVENAPFYHAYFPQNNTGTHYFDLFIGNKLHLVVLDSGLTACHDGEQKRWLEERLKKHAAAPMKMAVYHVPIYPSVRFKEKNAFYRLAHAISSLRNQHNIASRLLSEPSRQGALHWAPLFDHHAIAIAFEHHDHAFKRTYPLFNGCINASKGTIYLGDGALAPFPRYSPIQKFCDYRIKKSIGHVQFFWLMTFSDAMIHCQAVTDYGKPIDQFSIKGAYE